MREALNGGELGRVPRERFDRILIRGDASAIDTVARYHFPVDLAARSVYTGYCARLASVGGRDELRAALGATDQRPLIVVATGGGSDGTTLLRSYLEMWRDEPSPDRCSIRARGRGSARCWINRGL